jgi:hypothetical protein
MPESTPRLPSLSSAQWVQPNLTASFISLCSVGDDMNLSARHLMLTWFFSYASLFSVFTKSCKINRLQTKKIQSP